MGASGTISNLQSALNCAGKCDCCNKLQSQINTINAKIAGLKNVDENALKSSLKASLEPSILSAVAGGIAVAVDKLKPRVDGLEKGLATTKLALDNARLAEELRLANLQNKFNSDLQSAIRRQAELDAIALRNASQNAVDSVARSKAGTALENAATASTKAVNAANDVTGLKGIINGLGSKLNAFGSAIAKLESAIGNALEKAAEAIGISKSTLAATGKLTGQVLQIFNVIGTIFTILDGMATREVLGARIDAIEAQVMGLGREISNILGSILPALKARIGANEVLANKANSIARDARLIGEAANLKAGTAQVTASRAEGYATTAQAKALQAQITADGAVRNASQANENATTAYQKAMQAEKEAIKSGDAAREASNIGNQAKRIAGEALGKAGIALTTALTAIALYQTVKGLRGLQGIRGLPGIPGRNGITTVIQLPGIPGRNGINGLPGRNGINGLPGRNGRDGIDVSPAEAASLRALIIAQHNQTRLNSTTQHSATRTTILTPIMAALAPILAICKQIFDVVKNFSNAAQLALLNIINNKLGGQLMGGISQHLANFTSWSVLDRVLNLLTLAATIHNAAMLSNDIGQTLLGAISNILSVFGIKNSEGNQFDISSLIGTSITNLMKSIIGEENYTSLSNSWTLANRIYQSTVNVANSVANIGHTIINGLEVVGGMTGKIGNALRAGGILAENAYQWFNPQPNYHSRVLQFFENAQQRASTIQQVTQVPIDVTNALTEFNNSTAELIKATKEDPQSKSKGIELGEAQQVKAAFDFSAQNSVSPDIATTDFNKINA